MGRWSAARAERAGSSASNDGRITGTVRFRSLYSLCALLLLVWGCPRRENAVRVVYVPPPPVVATPQREVSAVLIIEEPEPEPVAEEVAPPEVPAPAPQPPPRRRPPRADTTAPAESAAESAEPAPSTAEVPALAPRESPQQAAELQRRVASIQQDLQPRVSRLTSGRLSAGARKTLEDARTFLAQSQRALEEGDLLRALNLAEKSALLVTAVESMR